MELIISKSYIPFLIIIPIILVLAFTKPEETFDVNIGDTYYVIKNSHLGILLSIVYFLLASIHFLSKTYGVKLYDLTIIKGSFADNKISLRVKPLSNDVKALREVYLDVDVANSSFTAYKE